MAYNLNKTNGDLLVTVLDGTTTGTTSADTFSLIFIGKNYPNYGQIEQRNFLRLLENGANDTSPLDSGITALAGELWFDTANKKLNVFDGSQFKPVGAFSGPSSPLAPVTGDLWWSTTTNTLNVYSGTAWVNLTPGTDQVGGITGIVVERITDVDNGEHKVTSVYTSSVRTAIISQDSAFAPATPIDGYPVIRPGVNFGFGAGTGFAIAQTGAATEIINNRLNGNINLQANINSVSTAVLTVNGATGLITVLDNPTQNLGIATKSYVDTLIASVGTDLGNLATALSANVTSLNINAAAQATSINSLNSVKANLASPALTGIPTATTAAVGTANTQIATTAFVSTAVSTANLALKGYSETYALSAANRVDTSLKSNVTIISANIGTIISNIGNLTTTVGSLSTIKANLAGPAFTGVPTAPTAPSGTANTQIATTNFVNTAVSTSSYALWRGSNKYVSSLSPTANDGNNGDFWFQI